MTRCRAVFADAVARLDRPLGDAWFPTILLPEDDVRAAITAGLEAVVSPRLGEVVDPEQLATMRLDLSVKPASEQSELGPHQDYSLVDEDRATSLYVWVPLVDTDAQNGTLHVVPGSHRFANRIRSRHVPSTFDEALDLVHAASVRLDCAAGDLVVMVSGVVHHSPPNRGADVRVAVHGILVPVGEPLVFSYLDEATPDDVVECYEMGLDDYVRHIHAGRPGPEVALTRTVPRPTGSMGRDRFAAGVAAFAAEGAGATA